LNPYDPPTTNSKSDKIDDSSNPAKPLLYFIGVFCLFQFVIALPTGLFVGPHILGVAIAMLVFGTTAIWLAHRPFDGFGRSATIGWGILAVLLILVAIGIEPPSTEDVAVLIFTGLVLLVVGAVPVIAIQKRPADFVS
jgi:hypothetical protein